MTETLPAECLAAAEALEKLTAQFDALGWDRHASHIQSTASHLRIYARQVEVKIEGEL